MGIWEFKKGRSIEVDELSVFKDAIIKALSETLEIPENILRDEHESTYEIFKKHCDDFFKNNI